MQRIKKVIGLVCLLSVFTMIGFAQLNKEHFRVFDGQGNPANLEIIISKMKKSDVVFLGESHDDSVGHLIQFELFRKAFENYGKKRKVVLSLEMFERDVQIVLDEYLQRFISEKQFLASSRPWGNYQTDYRPLVEFAKENKLKVIAANAPRRYVNMVSRTGRDSVNKLSKKAKKWLAPLPFGNSSKAYSEKFNSRMAGHGSENILHSQTLWDATMAYSVFKQLKKNKKSLVLHLNGSFHTANRLGTVEHLLKFRPKTRIIVVTMLYEKDFQTFNREKHTDLGDFVIITDAQQPRSKLVRQ